MVFPSISSFFCGRCSVCPASPSFRRADLLGLRLTLELAKKTASFDYDLFFRSLGYKFFRIFKTREAAMESYSSDPHPACLIRTNYTFSQFEDFYHTYPSIQEGTAMYYPPEKRETLW